jgi:hypothetical protein
VSKPAGASNERRTGWHVIGEARLVGPVLKEESPGIGSDKVQAEVCVIREFSLKGDDV